MRPVDEASSLATQGAHEVGHHVAAAASAAAAGVAAVAAAAAVGSPHHLLLPQPCESSLRHQAGPAVVATPVVGGVATQRMSIVQRVFHRRLDLSSSGAEASHQHPYVASHAVYCQNEQQQWKHQRQRSYDQLSARRPHYYQWTMLGSVVSHTRNPGPT